MKKLTGLLLGILLLFPITISASYGEHVVDESGEFGVSTEVLAEMMLDDIYEDYGVDVLFVFAKNTNSSNMTSVAKSYYQETELSKNVIVAAFDIEEGKYGFYTKGTGSSIYDKDAVSYFEENILSYFASGEVVVGAEKLIYQIQDLSETYILEGGGSRPFSFYLWMFAICILLPIAISGGYYYTLYRDARNVRAQKQANEYVVKGSFVLQHKYDSFLYRKEHPAKTIYKSLSKAMDKK